MKILLTTLLGMASLALARVDAAADPFSIQPNGDLVVDTRSPHTGSLHVLARLRV